MIDHIWSIVCSRVILDEPTNNISLIDIIEEITLKSQVPSVPEGKIPFLTISITIVSLWRRKLEDQPTKGRCRICLLTPNLTVPDEVFIYEIDLLDKLRTRAYGTIPGFPFRGPGTYHFIIQFQDEGEAEWKESASIPLIVKMQTTQDTPPRILGHFISS